MAVTPDIFIRPVEETDIESIINYWLRADKKYLIGMGVDLNKLPPASDLRESIMHQINTPIEYRTTLALIYVVSGKPIGNCIITDIKKGDKGNMHLHIWNKEDRRKGLGQEMVVLSTEFFFNTYDLRRIICEPYALNPAPHSVLLKSGFVFEKKYHTTPGGICIENQLVSRYILTNSN